VLSIEYILLAASVLLLVSIVASKISARLGIPALLLFLAVGMLAGSEGLGGIYFDDPFVAQFLGVVALVFILFAGGLDTEWAGIRPVLGLGIALATLGVLISAGLVAWFATIVLGFSVLEGLLLGAIVSSTDEAAVFAVLRAKGIRLRSGLGPLVEMESGSNDPMAVFLTVGLTGLLARQMAAGGQAAADGSDLPGLLGEMVGLLPEFVWEMVVGCVLGYLLGRGIVLLINRIRLDYEGLYPVLTLTMMLLVYAATASVHGNGFLAVYIAGLVVGNSDFVHKRSLMRFHDGMAWLMQIAMFLTLGLLVFPLRIVPVIGAGIVVALFLMFVARPASVFVSLAISRLSWREKTFVAWAGLRGAVPVILATFPLLAGIPKAPTIFNLVFFIVLFSVLLQGTTLGLAARWLGVEEPQVKEEKQTAGRYRYPAEYVHLVGTDSKLAEITVQDGSRAAGKSIMELGLPRGALVVLVIRDNESLVPTGAMVVQAGDRLMVLADEASRSQVEAKI